MVFLRFLVSSFWIFFLRPSFILRSLNGPVHSSWSSALRAWGFERTPDAVSRWATLVGHLAKLAWLLNDHLLFLAKAKVLRLDTGPLGLRSAKCWLLAFTAYILRDLRKLALLQDRIAAADGDRVRLPSPSTPDPNEVGALLQRAALAKEAAGVGAELKRNALDICLPLASLGFLPPRVPTSYLQCYPQGSTWGMQVGAWAGVLSTLDALGKDWASLRVA